MAEVCYLIDSGAEFNLDEIDGKAALFFAASNDCLRVVKRLHSKGLDLNITDDMGKTAVFYANDNHSMYALCDLIGSGAEFNLDEIDGKAVLFSAASNDVVSVVDRLHSKGLDLNVTDDKGKTAVSSANDNHSMYALCDLISSDAEFNLHEIDGKAVLFFAATNDVRFVVYRLHSKGLDLNVTDDKGKTAVFHANDNHRMYALCELITLGAEFNLHEIDGKAVLFFAATNDVRFVVHRLHSKCLDLNITDDKGKTAVFYANNNHSMYALCQLITLGAEFNLDEIDGKAVLFFAATTDFFGVVEGLFSKGLDLNVTDDKGKTAVFYANDNHSMDALCELIHFDAEFNLDEIDGKAVLFFAATNDVRFVVHGLHSKCLDLNVTDDNGKTAVFYANDNHSMYALCELIRFDAEFNLDEIDGKAVLFFVVTNDVRFVVDRLHSKCLDLNVTDDRGKTAVFYANNNHSMYALCELISYGADFNLDEIDGKAVLFFAATNDFFSIVERLDSKGLDLNVTDDKGKTAVFYANNNHSMYALCELISYGAVFNLDEIDGKAVLFFASENGEKGVVKPLFDAGLDLNITDNEGKTVVFNCDEDFVDALMAVDDVLINARDLHGRTPLFYAVLLNTTTKARHLIKKGGNLLLKDNCNVSIHSFFIENFLSRGNVEPLQLYTSELFHNEQQLKALLLAIFDTVYCQTPLLSVGASPRLPKSYTISNQTNILKVLAFGREHCLFSDADKEEKIEKIELMIRRNEVDVQLILSLLNKLGANPNAADLDGNTALHYATLLPLFGATPKAVMNILKTLRKFGTFFDSKNHQRQSPLLFCLSSNIWKGLMHDNNWESSIKGLVEVGRFLLDNGCSITDGSQNAESIFHRIILLTQHLGLQVNEHSLTKPVLQVLIEVLKLLQPTDKAVRNAVNNFDTQLNSPLHLWAFATLKSSQDYPSPMTGDYTFESIMRIILDHILKCGATLNPRNRNEETPLHVCRTWTAVKLLLDAGAKPNDVDASGNSPLLVAAKDKSFPRNTQSLYPDVTEEPEMFWKIALEKGLDPLVTDKEGESLLSVLIKHQNFRLARALVEVLSKENFSTNEFKILLLDVICKDESKHTHWKSILVKIILNTARTAHLSLDSPLRFCCRNIVQYGLFDDKAHSIQQNRTEETSNDDVQPPPKKRKTGEPAKDQGKNGKWKNEERIRSDSVHCKIAKQLLSYGADIHIRDSSGMSCMDIAEDCPSLQELLKEPIQIDTLPILIPWTSVSDKCNSRLAKVARRQECKMMGQIWCHKDDIGSGSFGLIFAGINEKDGREVAVKRVEKLRMKRPEDKREIKNLTALADCEQVLRYISFFEDEDFSYVVLELMEGNLDEYLGGFTIHTTQATLLCKDIVMGIKFLHEQNILHRDLKPRNILYKVNPKLCLKIADFGLSRIIDSTSTTVYGTLAGTRCWLAPELLTGRMNSFEVESDMFSCGMLLHYILSGQRHPFSPTDCPNKTELQVSNETEANIMNGKIEGWDDSLHPEATHLVKQMLESNKKDRPSAREALDHPLFWSNEKKMDFLEAVGNQEEFRRSRSKRTPRLSHVETDLENGFRTIVKRGSWKSSTYKNMSDFYTEMTKGKWRKYYDTSSAVELVRFIRNVYEHFGDITFVSPVPIKDLLFTDFVFLENFPHLVMEVYKAVTVYGWDSAKEDIKCAINKK